MGLSGLGEGLVYVTLNGPVMDADDIDTERKKLDFSHL